MNLRTVVSVLALILMMGIGYTVSLSVSGFSVEAVGTEYENVEYGYCTNVSEGYECVNTLHLTPEYDTGIPLIGIVYEIDEQVIQN
ncbi:MAG: hypothetical protein R6V04_16470, partial [bacterium]